MTGRSNATLQEHLSRFAEFVARRINAHFTKKPGSEDSDLPAFSAGEAVPKSVDDFYQRNQLSPQAQTILLLALAPHVQADFYDRIIKEAIPQAGDFPQIGGTRGKNFRGFLPTGETALFLFAGEDMEKRMEAQQLFSEDHLFDKLAKRAVRFYA